MAIKIDQEKCNGCGACVTICPAGAIKIENTKALLDADNCMQCGVCIGACPASAIEQS